MTARAVLIVLVFGLSLMAQSASDTIAIVNTTVLPLTANGLVLANHTVVIAADRIAIVGPSASTNIPKGTRRIDGRGKFVIPGLADMHVHLEYFDEPGILGLFIANGVTTVRNMDGRPYLLDWRRRIAAGELEGPRIYTAGPLLDGSPPVRPDNTVVASASAARDAVAAQAAAGYDFIKVYSALSREAYDAIIAMANRNRLYVAGHVPRAVGLDATIASGLRSIEHLGDFAAAIQAGEAPGWSKPYLSMPVDTDRMAALGQRLAAARVWNVPTLLQPERELQRVEAISQRLASEEVGYIPADGRKQWESQARRVAARLDDDDWTLIAGGRAHRLMLVNAFHMAGVSILAGTDTPNPFVVPGFSLHDELELLVEGGLTPAQALAAATREAARFSEASDWGTIAAGKSADLVVLEANPLQRISNTRRIAGVVVRGRWIGLDDRAKMLAALKGS
jgi:imidazolonepropionase-like amidohydrolase